MANGYLKIASATARQIYYNFCRYLKTSNSPQTHTDTHRQKLKSKIHEIAADLRRPSQTSFSLQCLIGKRGIIADRKTMISSKDYLSCPFELSPLSSQLLINYFFYRSLVTDHLPLFVLMRQRAVGMGVLVGMHLDSVIQKDTTVFHGIDRVRCLGQKIDFMRNDNA